MSIQEYVTKRLKSGQYKLMDNEKGTSSMWSVYAMIVEENGSVLDGFIYCRKCEHLVKYGRKIKYHAYRHKCYAELKATTESDVAVSPNGGDSSSTNVKDNEENIEDILLENPQQIHEYTENLQYIESQIRGGVYKLKDKNGFKSKVWSYFKTIHREDGSQIDNYIWCPRCEKLFANQRSTSNLSKHKCVLKGKRKNKHHLAKMAKMDEDTDDTKSLESKEDMLISDTEDIFARENPKSEPNNDKGIGNLDEFVISETELLNDIKIEDATIAEDLGMWEDEMSFNNSEEEITRFHLSEIEQKVRNGVYKLTGKPNSKSMVWDVYDQIVKDDGNVLKGYVRCRHCMRFLKFNGTSTSNLNRHKCYIAAIRSGGLRVINESHKDEAINVLSHWLVQDCLPCKIFEGEGFQKMLAFFIKLGTAYSEDINVCDIMPSYVSIADNLKTLAEEKKHSLKQMIEKECNYTCVTVELWFDSCLQRQFLSGRLYYHKNFVQNNIHLGTVSFETAIQKKQDFLYELERLTTEFGICKIENVIFVTDTERVVMDALSSPFSRITCSSHLLANVVSSAIEKTGALQEVLSDCKAILEFCKKYPIKMSQNSLRIQCGLNYALLQTVADNWRRIQEVLDENESAKQAILTIRRRANLNHIVGMCQKLEVIFKKLQASRSPSLCFVIPSINCIKAFCDIKNNEDPTISAFKSNILTLLEEIWAVHVNIWHKAAFFLYPPANKEQTGDLNEIKDFCIQQIMKMEEENRFKSEIGKEEQDNSSFNNDFPSTSMSSKTDEKNDYCEDSSNLNEDISFFFPTLVKKSLQTVGNSPADEVTRYSIDCIMINENFDAMQWWQQNSPNYPRLSKLAMRVLSIPASKTDTEKEISLARCVVAEKINNFSPKTVNNILFLNSLNDDKPI